MTHGRVQYSVKQIHESFQDARAYQPAYEQILPFFETLFAIQEAAVTHAHPLVPSIDAGLMRLTLEENLPLVDRRAIVFDQPAAMRLLLVICKIAQMANSKLMNAANIITRIVTNDEELMQSSLRQYMADDEVAMHRLGSKLDIEKDVLAFFFHHSIWPSLAKLQRAMADRHNVNGRWKQGACPICGSAPFLSFLSESGQRSLVCGFCRHTWSIDRIFCPSCHNRNSVTTGYFFCDREPAYRVNTCDQCKQYIKTIDAGKLKRYFYPLLESIVTTHLDIRAEALGYRGSGMDGLIQNRF